MATSTVDVVTGLYTHLLGRAADPVGQAYWVSRVADGHQTLAQVVTAFLFTEEVQSTSAALVRLYVSGLGRQPDADGLAYWLATHRAGMSLADIGASFAQSAEGQAQSDDVSDLAFVTGLYQAALGRAPEAGGLAYYLGLLADGVPREQIFGAIVQSVESVEHASAHVAATLVYLGVAGRLPTPRSSRPRCPPRRALRSPNTWPNSWMPCSRRRRSPNRSRNLSRSRALARNRNPSPSPSPSLPR
ncbi:DUF4214 domain-containing protein [Achromobacter sp. GG226]|nr:DUF4214 domain-containing protein [Verticiella sp. GG226]